MKKLSTCLFLILFGFSAHSFAEDISEYQIEGISIGDSALNFFSEDEIKINTIKEYIERTKDKKFAIAEFSFLSTFELYEVVQIGYKINDKKYIIHAIEGMITYRKNIKDCYKKQKEILKELIELFKNTKAVDTPKSKHPFDKSGKSFTKDIYFKLSSGDFVGVSCYDWSEEINYIDHLRLIIRKKEYNKWLDTL
jgi:hypothetical protein